MDNAPRPSAASRLDDPQFRDLVNRKQKLSLTLTLLVFVAYFGYMGLMAFDSEALSAPVGAATLGIPIGIGIIIFAWILTGVYVKWANGAYDAMVARVRADKK